MCFRIFIQKIIHVIQNIFYELINPIFYILIKVLTKLSKQRINGLCRNIFLCLINLNGELTTG